MGSVCRLCRCDVDVPNRDEPDGGLWGRSDRIDGHYIDHYFLHRLLPLELEHRLGFVGFRSVHDHRFRIFWGESFEARKRRLFPGIDRYGIDFGDADVAVGTQVACDGLL